MSNITTKYITPKTLARYMQRALTNPLYGEGSLYYVESYNNTNGIRGCVLSAAVLGKGMTRKIEVLDILKNWHKHFNKATDTPFDVFLRIPPMIARHLSSTHYDHFHDGETFRLPTIIKRLNRMKSWDDTKILFEGTSNANFR